jgi:D-beta-D-heptose 7-phosphate kinase/D-beta-D-heptose 1-phosphate adenosyltransferase
VKNNIIIDNMNVIIFGDIMIDINYTSEVTRNAPEADIPIYNILDKKYILGGAGNVCNNLKNLGVNVEIVSLIGNDIYGTIIKDQLNFKQIQHKLFIDNRNTIQKNRIFLNNKLDVRFDIEDTYNISDIIENEVIEYIINKKNTHAIVISDYDKGFVTEHLCQTIIKYANENNIPTFVDPKIKNYLKYKDCFLFKPNIIEAEKISNEENLDSIIHSIKNKIQYKNLLITRGKEGMILNSIINKIEHDSIINLVDVTGAGDIVLSVLVYYFLKERDMLKACRVANYVAGKSVGVIGNYNINKKDIDEYIINNNINDNDKIVYDYEIYKIEQISKNNNIVFTNGCFDILHSGHIKNLQFAKKNGDILVVGLNSDESIKRLKGTDRPINDINERSTILSLFNFIDYIIIFSDDTPINIIKLLKPSILIKGSDYKKEDIVGSEFVDKIILYDYVNGKSSTNIINKIKKI